MLGREALVPARGCKALGRLHEPARTLGKLVEIHVSSLVGHPLTRAEYGRTLMASGEARSRMPGRLATAPYMGCRGGAARVAPLAIPYTSRVRARKTRAAWARRLGKTYLKRTG